MHGRPGVESFRGLAKAQGLRSSRSRPRALDRPLKLLTPGLLCIIHVITGTINVFTNVKMIQWEKECTCYVHQGQVAKG